MVGERRLLLVTGARRLADLRGAEDWARTLVHEHLAPPQPSDVLLQGGAVGPDRWAQSVAHSHEIRVVTYQPDGYRIDSAEPTRRWSPTAVHPLARNDAMIAAAVRARGAGWNVGVLALFAPDATTHGTAYTADRAERAGLTVRRETYGR